MLMLFNAAIADHITGGLMSYTFVSSNNGLVTYAVTMKLYMRCNSGRQFNNPTYLAIFNRNDNSRYKDLPVPLSRSEIISLTDSDPCISNPPTVCYEVGYYETQITLPVTGSGYIIAGQVNFRIAGIANMATGYSQVGATYTTEIPGSLLGAEYIKNNSAVFSGSDLVVVCAHNQFTYSFAAEDPDKDSIRYYFCDAYKSSAGPSIGGNLATPPLEPPYDPVPYGNGYSGFSPLGINVSINSKTGIISGIAPEAGVYVVTVCAEEFKKGKLVGTQRKDLQIAITNCTLTSAVLPPEYQLCRDTKTITLINGSLSTLVNDYRWEIFNSSGKSIFTSKEPTPSYTFPDTGLYSAKLVINPGQRCTDSAKTIARVYPGFKPAFNFSGVCFSKPTNFTDATTSVYGQEVYHRWKFTDIDSSVSPSASFTFGATGEHNVLFTASDSKGCTDSISRVVTTFDKPPVDLAFRDTLICPPDRLQLKVNDAGNFVWSPASALEDPASGSPFTSPVTTTKYYVDAEKDGCTNRDSLIIRVTKNVELSLMNDTTICTGDATVLRLNSNAVFYRWTPSQQLNDATLQQPLTTTRNNITYTVVAGISSCRASGSVRITTVNYAAVNAGKDTIVCFNGIAHLHGTTTGTSYHWINTGAISNSNILNPDAEPLQTTSYVLQAIDETGCPKPVYDTVLVTVLPRINAAVTNDTSLITGEQIQLHASGGTRYTWQPVSGLSNSSIADPVASFSESIESLRYEVDVYNEAGCYDSAFVTLKVFSTGPQVFVPTGFTPNGDGKNDLLKPIAVGMKSIERFTVFNRFGQQVFFTKTNGQGWDGRVNGILEQTGTYVWMVQAIDYTGKVYKRQGTATLIR